MGETPKEVLDYYGTSIPEMVGRAVRKYGAEEGVEQPFSSVVLVVSDGRLLGDTRMHVTSIEDCDGSVEQNRRYRSRTQRGYDCDQSLVMVREDGKPPEDNVYYLVDDEQVKVLTYKLVTQTDFVVEHAKDEYLPLSESEAEVSKPSHNQGSTGTKPSSG